MENLGRFVCCDKCPFRPFVLSPLEPYYASMLLTMTDSLLPFQLLNTESFQEYYLKMIEPSILIQTQVGSYNASVWKVQAMIYLVLFFYIIGPHRYTRYQHGICYGEYWINYSFKLLGTPRAMFGMDAAERWNNNIKEMVLSQTNKFQSIHTLGTPLRLAWIKRYYVREASTTKNTAYIASANRVTESFRDSKLIHFTDTVRHYFNVMNVKGCSMKDKLIRFIAEPELYSRLDIFAQSLDPGDSLDSDEYYSSESSDDSDSDCPIPDLSFVATNPKMIKSLKKLKNIKIKDVDSGLYEKVNLEIQRASFRLQQRDFVLSTKFVLGTDDNQQSILSENYEIHWKTLHIYKFCYFQMPDTEDLYLFFKFAQAPTLLTSQLDPEDHRQKYMINIRNCSESMVCTQIPSIYIFFGRHIQSIFIVISNPCCVGASIRCR